MQNPDLTPVTEHNLVLFPAPYGDTGFNPYDVRGDRWLYDEVGNDSRLLGLALISDNLATTDLDLDKKEKLKDHLDRGRVNLIATYDGLDSLRTLNSQEAIEESGFSANDINRIRQNHLITIERTQRLVNRGILRMVRNNLEQQQ